MPTRPKKGAYVAQAGTEFAGEEALRASGWGKWAWLVAFVVTGWGLALDFELLSIHAGPARYDTFFLCLVGYWANMLTGLLWVVGSGSLWRRDVVWTPKMIAALLGTSICDGAAQALNFVAQIEGGIMLFTIFQSSVTLFACIIAAAVLGARLRPMQWLGVVSIVMGLMLTSIPTPLVARHSFFWGLVCSMLGSLLLATSYPLSELVFRLAPAAPPSAEMACFLGSLINVVLITVWTVAYTLPRWDEAVVQPLRDAKSPSVFWAVTGYSLFGVFVGVHSLGYWKSICTMGTVATAVSKGVQQAGNFIFLHLVFCGIDSSECIWQNGTGAPTTWSRMQKPVAFICCCGGVLLYGIGKERRRRTEGAELAETELEEAANGEEVTDDEILDPDGGRLSNGIGSEQKAHAGDGLRAQTAPAAA